MTRNSIIDSIRTFTKIPPKNRKIESINMSFASYESTQSQAGAGSPPLIIMHGILGSKANWNTLCKLLQQQTSPQRKIISVDARNHGDSPHARSHTYADLAEDIKALLSRLKVPKAALLGHSMGGRAMMYFALKYPDLVDRLVVADISPVSSGMSFRSANEVLVVMQRVVVPKNKSISAARSAADMQLAQHINNKGLRSFILTNFVQKADGSYAWRINVPALLANFSHIVNFPQVNSWKFIGPVLFVAGGKSDFIQKSDHAQILKLFPKAEFQVVEGAGHWIHSEKPQEFLKLCLEFLNKKVDGK